jgi:hypothetical protein
VDTGECGDTIKARASIAKSGIFIDKVHNLSAYGVVSYRHYANEVKKNQCQVVYEFFVAVQSKPFVLAKRLSWDTEAGEIAGIDLIGVSPDGTKLAADFWVAEGDGEEHRPVVYDISTGQALDLPLQGKIQSQIHGCDQNEDFIGVTNPGEAVFAVPPSVYDGTAACGDKGLWHFNLKTGRVYRVAKNSGDKWH